MEGISPRKFSIVLEMGDTDIGFQWRRVNRYVEKYKVHAGMVAVEFGYGGLYTLTKYAENNGMSFFVFIVYRHALATLAITPFAYFLESVTLDQNLYYAGLSYTSPTFASALVNVMPAMTFVMAVLLRIEKVDLRRLSSLAKILGTVICIGGSTVTTLYKGPAVGSKHGFTDNHIDRHQRGFSDDWVKGCLLVLASVVTWAAWFNMQAVFMKSYAAPLSMNAFMCFFGTIQSAVLTLVLDRDRANWILKWDLPRVLTVIYSGVVCSGIIYCLQTWCIEKRGPLFVAVYSPLVTFATTILSLIFLQEILHWGSVAGVVLIVSGLYIVLWGKAKENDDVEERRKIITTTSTMARRRAHTEDIVEELLPNHNN